jgi:diaminohydroxyphosphoribosylaminopyrimidine deaminase/5-amino-6-(5-phosphoribosylamino)uracil reductase
LFLFGLFFAFCLFFFFFIFRIEQPWRVIVTRSGALPSQARIFIDEFRDRTLVFRNESWDNLLAELGRRGVTRLLVEGGGQIIGDLLDHNLIDEVWCFYAPYLTGGDTPAYGGRGAMDNGEAKMLRNVRFRKLGPDVLMTADIE